MCGKIVWRWNTLQDGTEFVDPVRSPSMSRWGPSVAFGTHVVAPNSAPNATVVIQHGLTRSEQYR